MACFSFGIKMCLLVISPLWMIDLSRLKVRGKALMGIFILLISTGLSPELKRYPYGVDLKD